MYMFSYPRKQHRPNSWPHPPQPTPPSRPLKCCAVAMHTGGKRFCVTASESASPPIIRMTRWCFSLDEGKDSKRSSCRDELEFAESLALKEPGRAGLHRADAGDSRGSVTFQGMQQTRQWSTRSYHFCWRISWYPCRMCVCIVYVICICVYEEVCLTLNVMDCCIIVLYMSQCARKQQHLLFSLVSLEGNRMNKEKTNNQMFTKKQGSWQIPDERIWVCFSFFFFFAQKPEQQLLMGPSSRRRLSDVRTWSWWLLPLDPPHPSIRPLGGQASWGPGFVWPGKSFRHWTVRPPSCHSGTCWETRSVWSGSSAGCPGWAASCSGWPQTPDGVTKITVTLMPTRTACYV